VQISDGRYIVNDALVAGAMRVLGIARACVEDRPPNDDLVTLLEHDPDIEAAYQLVTGVSVGYSDGPQTYAPPRVRPVSSAHDGSGRRGPVDRQTSVHPRGNPSLRRSP
jgi:hypothetical protein